MHVCVGVSMCVCVCVSVCVCVCVCLYVHDMCVCMRTRCALVHVCVNLSGFTCAAWCLGTAAAGGCTIP
jgi:hypothetical protein